MHRLTGPRATRRRALQMFGLAGVGLLPGSLLAACGAATTATASVSARGVTESGKAAPASAMTATTSVIATATSERPTASTSGGGTTTSNGATAQGHNPTGRKGEITWLVRNNKVENDWEQHVAIPGFAKVAPDVTINLLSVIHADFDTKLFALFAAGTPVDVWSHWGVSGFGDYNHKGLVADLTPYISADHFDLNSFLPGLAETYKQGGKYLGLPNDTTFGMPLFYDVNLLQQAGVARPPTDWTNPWTWDQFTEAAKKVTRAYGATNATYGVTVVRQLQVQARSGGIELYSPEALQTGLAKPADYHADAPEVLAGVQAVYDLIYKDKVSPTPALASQISANKVDPFGAQRLAMNWAGGYEYWNYRPTIHSFQWAPAADPKLRANTATNFTDPWMLSSKSADPANAWKFIAYLVDEPAQTAFMQTTGAPPANAGAAAAWVQAFTAPTGLSVEQLQQVTQGALQHGHESYNHLLVGYDAITKAENDAMDNVWSGKLSPHDGLLQAKQQVDAVLLTIQ